MAHKANEAEVPKGEKVGVLERYQREISQMRAKMASAKAREHAAYKDVDIEKTKGDTDTTVHDSSPRLSTVDEAVDSHTFASPISRSHTMSEPHTLAPRRPSPSTTSQVSSSREPTPEVEPFASQEHSQIRRARSQSRQIPTRVIPRRRIPVVFNFKKVFTYVLINIMMAYIIFVNSLPRLCRNTWSRDNLLDPISQELCGTSPYMSPEELLKEVMTNAYAQNETLYNMAQMGPDLSQLLGTLTLIQSNESLSMHLGLWIYADDLMDADNLTASFRNFSRSLVSAYDSTGVYLPAQRAYFYSLSSTAKYIYNGLHRIVTQHDARSDIHQTLLNALFDCLPFLYAWTPGAEYLSILDEFVDMQLEQLSMLIPEASLAKEYIRDTNTYYAEFGSYVESERKQLDDKCAKASARILNAWLSTTKACEISLLLPEVSHVKDVTGTMSEVMSFMEAQLHQMWRALLEIRELVKLMLNTKNPLFSKNRAPIVRNLLEVLLDALKEWEQVAARASREMMIVDKRIKRRIQSET